MTPETKLDLSAIKARCAAATPGPWRGDRHDGTAKYSIEGAPSAAGPQALVLRVDHKDGEYGFVGLNGTADEAFVLAARTDVPALVAEVERLEAAVQKQAENSRANYEEGVREFDQKVAALRRAETAEALLAECYRLTGADPDGNDDSMLAGKAVDAVRRLRAESEHQGARADEFAEGAKGLREIVALALEALRCTDAHDAAWEAYEAKRRANNYYQDDPVFEFDRDERTKDWPETATALRTGEARGAALDARDAALRTLLAKGGDS